MSRVFNSALSRIWLIWTAVTSDTNFIGFSAGAVLGIPETFQFLLSHPDVLSHVERGRLRSAASRALPRVSLAYEDARQVADPCAVSSVSHTIVFVLNMQFALVCWQQSSSCGTKHHILCWEFRVLSGSGRGSQVRLIGRFAPATPRFYRFPAGMDSSPSAQVQLLP